MKSFLAKWGISGDWYSVGDAFASPRHVSRVGDATPGYYEKAINESLKTKNWKCFKLVIRFWLWEVADVGSIGHGSVRMFANF